MIYCKLSAFVLSFIQIVIYEEELKMLIIGIVISIISTLLIIFPKLLLNLKSPDTAFLQIKGLHNNKKVILAVRVWGIIFLIIGISLIIISII